MNNQLIILGDTHGDHAHVAELARTHRPAAMIHVGDFDLETPFRQAFAEVLAICPLYFVAGNHDFDNEAYYDHLYQDTAELNLHGRVVEIAGKRVAGLAGNFQAKTWYPPDRPAKAQSRREFLHIMGKGNWWRGGLPLKRRGAIWPAEYDALAAKRADVLVTHEAPGCHRYGFDVLTDLAHAMGASTHYHGHLHVHYADGPDDRGLTVRGVALGAAINEAGEVLHWHRQRSAVLDESMRRR